MGSLENTKRVTQLTQQGGYPLHYSLQLFVMRFKDISVVFISIHRCWDAVFSVNHTKTDMYMYCSSLYTAAKCLLKSVKDEEATYRLRELQ
jgi:hypothetical protein